MSNTPESTVLLPSAADVRAKLAPLQRFQLVRLAELSGVSLYTVLKIASGETADPRLDTVRELLPHIDAAARFERA